MLMYFLLFVLVVISRSSPYLVVLWRGHPASSSVIPQLHCDQMKHDLQPRMNVWS